MKYYITMDLETDGLDVCVNQPIQMAYQVHNSAGRKKEEKSILIHPPLFLPDSESFLKAQEFHGIPAEDILAKGITIQKAVRLWMTLVWNYQPVHILGFNLINFDWPIWSKAIYEVRKGEQFIYPPVSSITDVMFLARDFFKERKWPKLENTARRLDIEVEEEKLHDALYDVELTWKVFEEIKRLKGEFL